MAQANLKCHPASRIFPAKIVQRGQCGQMQSLYIDRQSTARVGTDLARLPSDLDEGGVLLTLNGFVRCSEIAQGLLAEKLLHRQARLERRVCCRRERHCCRIDS